MNNAIGQIAYNLEFLEELAKSIGDENRYLADIADRLDDVAKLAWELGRDMESYPDRHAGMCPMAFELLGLSQRMNLLAADFRRDTNHDRIGSDS